MVSYLAFRSKRIVKTSRLLNPRSTKSPCKSFQPQVKGSPLQLKTTNHKNSYNSRTHHEYVIRIRDMPSSRKELHQVMELSMDVTTHSHRAVNGLHI
jgi:hypothetical protein